MTNRKSAPSTPKVKSQMPADLIEVGKIGKPVGLHGHVLVWLNDPESDVLSTQEQLWVGDGFMTIELVRPKPDAWEVGFAEVTTREGAEALTHLVVSAPREELGEGEFYVEDLRGRRVVDEQGVAHGTVLEIVWAGARALLEVGVSSASAALVPVDGPFIVSVTDKQVVVSSTHGLFDHVVVAGATDADGADSE